MMMVMEMIVLILVWILQFIDGCLRFKILDYSLVVCFVVVYVVISLIMRRIRICLMRPESISIMRLIRISMMGPEPHEHFNDFTPNHHPIAWLDSSSFPKTSMMPSKAILLKFPYLDDHQVRKKQPKN